MPEAKAVSRLVFVFGIVAGLVMSLSACALIGDPRVKQNNLAAQRISALKFVQNQPDVQIIKFTGEGSRPGLGASWSANAIVTIGGKEYHEILGPNFLGGESLPDTPPLYSALPVTVIYSDGTTEVLP